MMTNRQVKKKKKTIRNHARETYKNRKNKHNKNDINSHSFF